MVDELDALGQIDGLKDALARLRKFGGRCVLGFQSIAQVSATYGSGEAQTIVENCGNTLILRCSGSEHGGTSQFASTPDRPARGAAHCDLALAPRHGDVAGRSPRSEHLSIEPAVMGSEIEQLPDLSGYLKLASRPQWLRVRARTRRAPRALRPPHSARGRIGRQRARQRAVRPRRHPDMATAETARGRQHHEARAADGRRRRRSRALVGDGAREAARAHGRGLEAVVREEIRATLIEELQALVEETPAARRACCARLGTRRDLRSSRVWTLGIGGAGVRGPARGVACVDAARAARGGSAARTRDTELTRRASRGSTQQGGRIELRRCGTAAAAVRAHRSQGARLWRERPTT